MGWLYPHSPSAGCEAATLPLRSLRMSSAPASNPSSRRTRGRVAILGCGRFQCKLETLLPPSRPFPSTRRTHLKPCARVQFKRSPDPQLRGAGPGRGRASPASDSGLLGPEVGGSRRDPPGLRGGSCPALRHRAVGAETGSGPSPFRRRRLPPRAFLQRRFAPVAFFYRSAAAGTAGGGWSAGRDLRANEWAPRGRARAGLKGIRTVRIAPRARLSPSPPPPPTSLLFLLCRTELPGASENKQLGLREPPPRPRELAGPGPHLGRPPAHHEEDPRQCHRHPDRSVDPGHFLLLMAGQPSPRSILGQPGRSEGWWKAGAAPRRPHHPAHCESALRVRRPAGEPRRSS